MKCKRTQDCSLQFIWTECYTCRASFASNDAPELVSCCCQENPALCVGLIQGSFLVQSSVPGAGARPTVACPHSSCCSITISNLLSSDSSPAPSPGKSLNVLLINSYTEMNSRVLFFLKNKRAKKTLIHNPSRNQARETQLHYLCSLQLP